jgi:toxin ParE1/3/4
VAKKHGQVKVVLSPQARRDVREILVWTQSNFGRDATLRYEDLIVQALRDIEANMECPGSQDRSDLQKGIRSYHLSFSHERARSALGIVHKPRHFVIYRPREGHPAIDILRILHDERDPQRHLSEESGSQT